MTDDPFRDIIPDDMPLSPTPPMIPVERDLAVDLSRLEDAEGHIRPRPVSARLRRLLSEEPDGDS